MNYNTDKKRTIKHLASIFEIKERIAKKKSIIAHPNAIHLILSEHMDTNKFKPKTSLEILQRQIDINDVWSEDFDINNSILADEPEELKQEEEFYEERFLDEYEDTFQYLIHQSEDE